MENVWHKNSRDLYDTRCKIQRHYDGETYQLQLDSHHRFVKDWDTKLIKMLHNCDAGEYSVITTYVTGYDLFVNFNDNSNWVELSEPQMQIMYVQRLLPGVSFPAN